MYVITEHQEGRRNTAERGEKDGMTQTLYERVMKNGRGVGGGIGLQSHPIREL